jgi:hypothetical protein
VPGFSRRCHIPTTRARQVEVNLEIKHWLMTK